MKKKTLKVKTKSGMIGTVYEKEQLYDGKMNVHLKKGKELHHPRDLILIK